MYVRPISIILALATGASAKYESFLLPETVARAICAMEDLVPTLAQMKFLYSVDRLHEPTIHIEGEELSDEEKERHADLASALVSHPSLKEVFWGFESGAFDTWKKPDEEIPAEYEGVSDLASRIFGHVEEDLSVAYYYADSMYQIIEPPYKTKDKMYDPTVRPWYQDALTEEIGAWSGPYKQFHDEYHQISPVVNLHDAEGKLLGAAGMTITIDDFETLLIEMAEKGKEGTVLYINQDWTMIAASEYGVSYDAVGNQLPVTDSPDKVIAESVQALKDNVGDFDKAIVMTMSDGSKWFVASQAVGHVGGLPFSGEGAWYFNMAQPAECDDGYELDEELAECVCA